MYVIVHMYPMHCGTAFAVENGELAVGSATDVMVRAYISLINCGCTADGYATRVDAFRRIGAIMMIVEDCAGV